MKRLFFSILILLISVVVGYQVLCLWKELSPDPAPFSKGNLHKAIPGASSNPDPFYRWGLFYLWDIRNIDLRESLKYMGMAIERNPMEQDYWLNLAKILHKMGEKKAFERALENAILLFPAGYPGRWIAGNLFLQQGAFEKAIPHFSYLLTHYPDRNHLVYDVLARAVNDFDLILEKVVPRDSVSFRHYLSYLYEMGDQESVQRAWQKKAHFAYQPDREETLRHIEYLISRGDLHGAFSIWRSRLQEEGWGTFSDKNWVTNGGFEKEKFLGGGFDWKMDKVAGAEISFDSSVAWEGKRSLKIVFSGKENVDFSHVYQWVPLKPNTDYLLSAHMKTRGITTKSGLKLEISGLGSGFHQASETLVGDHDWKELLIAFRTPAQCQGGRIGVRRNKTDKFDRFISGTVWIDQVRLNEK